MTTDWPARLRVLSLNLWGQFGDWEKRRTVLQDGLRELNPDLAAFVEANCTADYDQVADLLESGYHIAHAQIRARDGAGISIASRWPIGELHELDLHLNSRPDPDFPCATLAAEISVPGQIGQVLFVNFLPSWELHYEAEREIQAVATARFIDEVLAGRDMHAILAGDLDADPAAGSIRFWTGRQALDGMSVCYRDAWDSVHPGEAGHTFTPDHPLVADAAPDWPFRRIDYIFVRSGEHAGSTLAIKDAQLAFDKAVDGVWASDHIGVVADLAAR
jgi:endonuclease/exonuclease/phosphatase family metal-dependent hydrolase